MCGIVGIFGNVCQNDQRIFEEFLWASKFRGPHSTGVGWAKSYNGTPNYLKASGGPERLMGLTEWGEAMQGFQNNMFIMGHNRWATMGNVVGHNAHPFLHGNVLLAHNGGVRNGQALSGQSFEVDSEHVAWLMNSKGPKYTLEHIQGDFALTWYNKEDKSFNLVRNSARPLWIAKNNTRNTWYYASEVGMLEWILTRNGVVYTDPKLPAAGTVISWNSKAGSSLYARQHTLADDAWRKGNNQNHWDSANEVEGTVTVGDSCSLKEAPKGNKVVEIGRKPARHTPYIAGQGVYNSYKNPHTRGEKFLKDHNVGAGDRIKAHFYRFEEYEIISRGAKIKGKAIGRIEDDTLNKFSVIHAHNIELDSFFDSKIKDFAEGWYTGIVRTCYWAERAQEYIITVDDLTKSTVEEKSPLLRTMTATDEEKKEAGPKSPLVLTKDEFQAIATLDATSADASVTKKAVALGPSVLKDPLKTTSASPSESEFYEFGPNRLVPAKGGALIPMREWEAATKDGCEFCGSQIRRSEILRMAWDSNNNPYCPVCIPKVSGDSAGFGLLLTPVGIEGNVDETPLPKLAKDTFKAAMKMMAEGAGKSLLH